MILHWFHFMKKCGKPQFRKLLDDDLRVEIRTSFREVTDQRVAQLASNFLERTVIILSSHETHASSMTYRPFRPNPQKKALYIGHIHDRHFVPLVLESGITIYAY